MCCGRHVQSHFCRDGCACHDLGTSRNNTLGNDGVLCVTTYLGVLVTTYLGGRMKTAWVITGFAIHNAVHLP